MESYKTLKFSNRTELVLRHANLNGNINFEPLSPTPSRAEERQLAFREEVEGYVCIK
jgi:hypothetical protein